jgi:class 3 adenylate cyclase/TolB-like protein
VEQERVQRRLAAIMAADVVGYSYLMGKDEAGTHARLKTLRRQIIGPRIKARRGRIVKLTGDGALVEFASAIEAVTCAIEIQRTMLDYNAEVPEEQRIVFRIGLNVGDLIIEDDRDIFGDGVNVAARLETLAPPGGIAISRAVRDQVRDRLSVGFEDRGEHHAKNITRPVRVFALDAEAIRLLSITPADDPDDKPGFGRLKLSRRGLVAAGLVALAALVGAGSYSYSRWVNPQPSVMSPFQGTLGRRGPTVVVLPFVNLTGDPAQDGFAEGLSEDVVAGLSRFRELGVATYPGSASRGDEQAVAQELGTRLGAQYVVQGEVRIYGNRVRLTAHLVEARTGTHVWTNTQDRSDPAMNLFAMQRSMAETLGAAIGGWDGAIAMAELQRTRAVPAAELTSYECLVQAHQALTQQTSTDVTRRSLVCLEATLRRRPYDARAWAMLANVLANQRIWGTALNPPESDDVDKRAYLVDKVLEAATKAVELAPEDPFSRLAMGRAFYIACRKDPLREEASRTLAAYPNDADAHGMFGSWLIFVGLQDVGRPLTEKGIAMTAPNTPRWWWWAIAKDEWRKGEYERALEAFQKAYLDQQWLSHLQMAYTLPLLGRLAEAQDHVHALLRLKPGFTIRDAIAYYKVRCFDEVYRAKVATTLRQAGLPE